MRAHTQARALGVAIAAGMMLWSGSAAADVVTDWNAIAIARIVAANRPGPSGIVDAAVVHAAIHDAVQAYQHRFAFYDLPIAGATGSPAAAVAKAARDVLFNRLHNLPGQTTAIDNAYNSYLSQHFIDPNDPGVGVGAQAASNVIARRANDGSFPATSEIFTGLNEPGKWRPTGPAFLPMAAPWLGGVVPFALRDSDGLLPEPPPPALTSGEYTNAYNEVKALGARTNSTRTPEQTDIAYFYSGNFLAQLNLAVREVADAHLGDIGDSARLFALANIAGADAIISCWNVKRFYFLWRPSTAINEGDNDGNPRTAGDPAWLPLIDNPPYPDYTSGANSITAAFARTLSQFFETDDFTFTVRTSVAQAIVKARTYNHFSDLPADVVEARIYLGIHFRFADTVARRQGRQAADWAISHILTPIE